MSLDVVQAVAEIVSAVGIVVTLVYLAIQVRQSSTVSRADIRQELAAQQIEMLRVVAVDPTLRAAVRKSLFGEELNDDERHALFYHDASALRLFESCHAQWEFGTLSDDDWRAVLARYAKFLESERYGRVFALNNYNSGFATLVLSLPKLHPVARMTPEEVMRPRSPSS